MLSGIDGVITFTEGDSIKRILVRVKSGKLGPLHVKEPPATLQPEGWAIGILIELDKATPGMERAALQGGQYEIDLWGGKYDRIQILTVENCWPARSRTSRSSWLATRRQRKSRAT